jgi:hypothetical protein
MTDQKRDAPWWVLLLALLFFVLVWSVSFSGNVAFGQQCKARPISGTGTASSYAVFLNGERYSQHTTARRAVIQMEVLMEAEPLAQVVVMEYLWGIWQDNQKRDCAPRSERPPWPLSLLPGGECPSCPPPDTVRLPAPPPDTVRVPEPVVEFEPDSVGYFPKAVRLIALGENPTAYADTVTYGKVWRDARWPDTLYVFQREDGTWPGWRRHEAVWKDGRLWWAAKLGAKPFAWDAVEIAADSSTVTYRASGTYLVEVQPFQHGTALCRVPMGGIIEALWTDVFVHGPEQPPSARFNRLLLSNPAEMPLCEVAP